MDDRDNMEARLDRLLNEPVIDPRVMRAIRWTVYGALGISLLVAAAGCSSTNVEYCNENGRCITYRSFNNDLSVSFESTPEGAVKASVNRNASEHLAEAVSTGARTTNAVIERLLATEIDP